MNTMSYRTAASMFADQFDHIGKVIGFDPDWHNGTGYFNALQQAKGLVKNGEFAKTVDNHGRRIIVLGTALGNVVIFERNSPSEEQRSQVLVTNCPTSLKHMLMLSGALTPDHLDSLIGSRPTASPWDNVGSKLDTMIKAIAHHEAEDEEAHLVG